jgi:putative membrane protein insertion efficiency factor
MLTMGACAAFPWTQTGQPMSADAPWGPDAKERSMIRRDTAIEAEGAARGVMTGMVRFYQDVLRRSVASDCQFHPSCSNYSIEAIAIYGPAQGLAMTADRLQRCHMFTSSEYPTTILYENGIPVRKFVDHPASNSLQPFRLQRSGRPGSFRQPSPVLKRIAEAAREKLKTAGEAEKLLFNFALDLTLQADYYRAVTEYKRFVHQFPDSKLASDARLLQAIATLFADRIDEATRFLEETPAPADLDGESMHRYLLAYAYFSRQRYAEALAALGAMDVSNPDWAAEVKHMKFVTLVASGEYDQARELFPIPSTDEISSRSPTLSGIMSAILPGSGQVYCGRPGDAAAAFVLTGVFAAATWEAAEEELEIVAGLTAVVGLLFYIGNIYGAVNGAHRYNEESHLQYRQKAILETRGPKMFWNLEQDRPGSMKPFDPRNR